MRKLFLITSLIVLSVTVFAQSVDTRRKVEVYGSAETEVTPDIIYVAISVKEYYRDNNNKKKTEIDEIEKQLQAAVLKAGIAPENFMINNISSYNYTWERKKNPDFLARKQYRIKVTDLSKFNQILTALDPKAIEFTNIESYDYSKMESLKKDLKIKALQAAKDKASYLAAAVGDKIGGALEIQEINNDASYPQPHYRANVMMSMDKTSIESAPMPDIDFKKIKLNYQMRAIFELK